MDLSPYLGWIIFLHVAGAFMFAAGHGVSMFVAFRVRKERDRTRLAALLDLSAGSLNVAGIGLLVLLVAGILAGIVAASFDRWWIWISLVLLVVIGVAMTPIGSNHFSKVRAAIGQRTRRLKPADPDPVPVADAELEALLVSRVPETLLLLGAGGFIVILWLMRFRPF
jgi:MFS family permease